MRPLRSLFALAAAASVSGMLLASPITAAGAVPPTSVDAVAAEEGAAASVLVEVVPGNGGAVAAGSDLSVQVRISNPTDSFLPGGIASLRLDPVPITGRAELSEWILPATEGTDAAITGDPIAEVPTPTLGAGGSSTLDAITVPAASLPFAAGSPLAVHRLSVTLEADDVDATAFSAVAVDPGTPVPQTGLAVAMPITVPPVTGGVIPLDDLEAYTTEGGILDLQLRQAAASPVAVGIDPRIIASAALLGDTAPESVLDWLDRLRTLPNETFPLGYADADIAAMSQSVGAVLAPTGFVTDPDRFPEEAQEGEAGTDDATGGTAGESTEPPLPDPALPAVPTQEELLDWEYTTTGIAWPRDDTVVATDLDVFAASGLPTTIVSSTNSTAGAAASASASAGGHAVITSDAPLSELLRTAVAATSPFSRDSSIALMAASLAAASAEGGGAGPVVLATLDRSTPSDSFALASTLAAVSTAPWATPATLSDARARAAEQITIVDRPVDPSRTGHIATMATGEPALAAFATVLIDPTPITAERRLSLLATTSQGWAAGGQDWEAAVAGYLERSNEILASVAVGSRTLTQASDNGDLPIVVTNALDFPATVTVNVQALRPIPILTIGDPAVEITIPANSQQRAPIPTEAIANGEVALSVSLVSTAGVAVGPPSIVDVSVRAGWETAATTVLAILVVAVFVFGIIRTVRRRRRIARGELPDDREGDARDLHDGESAEAHHD